MRNWKTVVVQQTDTLRDTIAIIDASAVQIALVADECDRLLGTVTDGDIRRGLLKGVTLEQTIDHVMNNKPTVASHHESREAILAMMKRKRIHQIPVTDDEGRIVGLEILDELLTPDQYENIVVIMAGGLGSRLRPLTDNCPKPLLKIGTKPILETIVESFIEHGFRRFFFAVNYKADMIEAYFGNGSRWGADIQYIHENRRMGTAGALSLLPELPEQPFFVMNGDILTKINFQQLLGFHQEHKASATMCVREYTHQIPYGVVEIDKHQVARIDEKPIQRCFVSAGIYVLEPEVLRYIPSHQFFDMPGLFERLIEEKQTTVAFPIREYWLDIGHIADFERAKGEFEIPSCAVKEEKGV